MSSGEMPHDGDEQPTGSSATGDEVGSLAEEAAKLAGAFAAWAVENGSRAGQQAHDRGSAFAASAHAAVEDLDEHLATGAQECTTCPICRTVSAVRDVSPEVRQHLMAAAGSLLAAGSGFFAAFQAAGRPNSTPDSGEPGDPVGVDGVERIDLDE